MDYDLISDVRAQETLPIIGIIGAGWPQPPYHERMGIEVGEVLRKFLRNRGTLFTGGIGGVGIDAYVGVTRYCVTQREKTQEPVDDRFFVLIPQEVACETTAGEFFAQPYEPPQLYHRLAQLSKKSPLKIIRAGKTMAERREYVARIADALVIINGSGALSMRRSMHYANPNPSSHCPTPAAQHNCLIK